MTTVRGQRVVVTGTGAVTSVGHSTSQLWQALIEGRSGIAPIEAYPVGDARPGYAGEVKNFSPEDAGLPRKRLKMMGRQAQLAYVAAHEAAQVANLASVLPDRTRLGIVLGVGMLNADVHELGRAFAAVESTNNAADAGNDFDAAAFGRAAAGEMLPLWLLRHIPNLAAAYTAIALDLQGPSNTIVTGCAAGANAIGEAFRTIARGEADIMLAGGADARTCPLAMLRYRDLGWLATRGDLQPAEVSAPFDVSASGFVSAEGAAFVVLESLAHAQRRGVAIQAELVAYGAANDTCTLLGPHVDGRGLRRALTQCLTSAELSADAVDVLFAPASAVPAYDRAAARAIASTLSGARSHALVTATRGALGHAHAASAAIDCVAAVRSIADARVPITLNLREPIADLRFATAGERMPVSTAIVGAYGFGGHGAAIAWRRFDA
jgi:3-oxoacyl-[acyl-carrier-protein] synthase II